MKSARLRTIAVRLSLLALAAALAGGSAVLLQCQAQQPASQAAKPDPAQSSSGQANSSQSNTDQSGAQNGQPQQNGGASAGAPMVLGAGDGEIAPVEQAPAQTPETQPVPDQSGQSAPDNRSVDQPASAQGGDQSPVPTDATSLDPAVAAELAALPPSPPDSSDPRKLVDWECADLLKLASDLKVAVDKTTKDELSLSVVRKAGEIEQMAHKLRDNMHPAVAGKN